uniref:Uncharacterized protein n=1 Tax=Meloidogyne hapla TaxID=6305 RepID=A0A1I8C1F7_MELHA
MAFKSITIILLFISLFAKTFSKQNEEGQQVQTDQQSKTIEKTFTKIGMEVPQPNQGGIYQYPPHVFGQPRGWPNQQLGYGPQNPQQQQLGYLNPNLYRQPGGIYGPQPYGGYNPYDTYNRGNIYQPPRPYFPGQQFYNQIPGQNKGL